MQLQLTAESSPGIASDLLGIIVFQEDLPEWGGFGTDLPPGAIAELLHQAIRDHRFKANAGQTLTIETQGHLPAKRLILAGAGPRSGFLTAHYRHAAAVIARAASAIGARSLVVLADTRVPSGEKLSRVDAIGQGLLLATYRFDKYLGADKRVPSTLEVARLQVAAEELEPSALAIARARRLADATAYARDLVNEPAGHLTPSVLATDVSERATAAGLDVTVLGPDACRARGMGMFLAVAQGSSQEPRFIHLAWRPSGSTRRVVLVGKGVTFDSGGLSLKTNEGMQDMKSDMAGAAAVLAAALVVAQEKLPIEVHALAACTENMPSGTAYKLGDVLRSMSGKTVEINNTDAEGRLTLGDALTYGLALKPDVILDFATLTGACVVALGPHMAGVMTNDDASRELWMKATATAGEDMWPLPLPPRLNEQLKSEIADMRNTGERWGGALTAGLFLKEFVGTTPWIHVDIAGPATASKEWGCLPKGATGFAVASIVEYLRDLSKPTA